MRKYLKIVVILPIYNNGKKSPSHSLFQIGKITTVFKYLCIPHSPRLSLIQKKWNLSFIYKRKTLNHPTTIFIAILLCDPIL